MLQEHCKLLAVLEETGEVVGRKKLQKIIYIMKKLNFPFYEKYEFHFYGPYSEELNLKVEEMCSLSFVEERMEKKSGYHQYRYTLTEKGKQFLHLSDYKLPTTNGIIQEMNKESARFLELVSTILYFESLPKDVVSEKIFTLKAKQNYTNQEIDAAYLYIDRLREKLM